MNRELKFRVFNGSDMEYSVGVFDGRAYYVNTVSDNPDEGSLTPYNTIYPEDTPIMQYTGIKDKNGVEIYEGDIVSGWIPDPNRDEYGFTGQVLWVEDGFSLCRSNGEYASGLIQCTLNNTIEVIGNIYENKELLNDN